MADIEKAFLMISIAEEDQDVLRFLLLENIKNELPRIQVLRFTHVMFGVSSSPFLLTPVPCKLNVFLAHFVELTFWKISRMSANCRNFVRK